MEPIEALNRPIKESHKYILAMYADGSYLYILLQHTENRDEIVTERLPLTSEKGVPSIEEAFSPNPILTRPFEKVFFIADSPRFIFTQTIRFDGGQSSLFRFLFSRQRRNFDFGRPTSNGSENTFRPEHRAVVFRETHVGPPRTATQAGSGVRILFQKKPIGIYV